jgi:4-carboxymuconolactone decarboxylase
MQHGAFGSTTGKPMSAKVPSLGDLSSEFVFGSVWARPHLDLKSRMICTLAVLAALYRQPLRTYVNSALSLGIPPETIEEVIIQVGWYTGFPGIVAGLETVTSVCTERKIERTEDVPPDGSSIAELQAAGHALAELGGGVGAGPGAEDLQALDETYGYGLIWRRPGLDPKMRSGVAVAALTALGFDRQLRSAFRLARHFGYEDREIVEIVIQTAAYGGFPRAFNALDLLGDV